MKRSQLLQELAHCIVQIELAHPIRVAIDGVDASGKTMLADELVAPIQVHGRSVIRASIDGFHNPAQLRYQLGPTSPEGYYHNSFNYRALKESLLAPLGQGGSRKYRPVVFDHRTDSEVLVAPKYAPANAVLLFDGIFLRRPELEGYWDFTIFVEAAFEVTLRRAQQRDIALFGNVVEVTRRYEQRYIPGQKLYLEACRPKERAAVVIDNNDPLHPVRYEGESRRSDRNTSV